MKLVARQFDNVFSEKEIKRSSEKETTSKHQLAAQCRRLNTFCIYMYSYHIYIHNGFRLILCLLKRLNYIF